MRRDPELIRKIILAVEEHPHGRAPRDLAIDGFSKEQIGYHIYLIGDAGLAQTTKTTHHGSLGPEAMLNCLTSAGHDFADACRNETVWNSTMTRVKQTAGTVTLAVLTAMLNRAAANMMGAP